MEVKRKPSCWYRRQRRTKTKKSKREIFLKGGEREGGLEECRGGGRDEREERIKQKEKKHEEQEKKEEGDMRKKNDNIEQKEI